jgi:hypothetical protein
MRIQGPFIIEPNRDTRTGANVPSQKMAKTRQSHKVAFIVAFRLHDSSDEAIMG